MDCVAIATRSFIVYFFSKRIRTVVIGNSLVSIDMHKGDNN